MAERANPLTKRASGEDQPANTLRVFLDSLARLGYDRAALLAAAGLNSTDLEDPDGRVPCEALQAMLKAALERRPLRNLAMRLAAETPLGAFPLIDYLVLTSDSVGDGLKQLARYYRLAEAPYSLEFREEEEPVRIFYGNSANAFALEFGVVLSLLHLRKETEQKFSAAYVSFSHRPEDVERCNVSLAARFTAKHCGTDLRCRSRHGDFRYAGEIPFCAACSSSKPTRLPRLSR
ncbi:MAG TPA: AraC family transcriptional regulator ligand-binding domain-containing protein [Bryobacteraceae bacterium]|jgi:hypothetical protein